MRILQACHVFVPQLYSPSITASALNSSFQHSFFSTAVSLNPNVHGKDDLKPNWPAFEQSGETMLFNITAEGEPEVMTIPTSDGLLERCSCVHDNQKFNSEN